MDIRKIVQEYFESFGKGKLPDDIKRRFLFLCEQNNWDPFSGEAYIIPYWDSKGKKNEWKIVNGYPLFTRIAMDSGRFNGFKAKIETDENGIPVKGTAILYLKGCDHPFIKPFIFSEFDQGNWMWKKNPYNMFWKVMWIHAVRYGIGSKNAMLSDIEMGYDYENPNTMRNVTGDDTTTTLQELYDIANSLDEPGKTTILSLIPEKADNTEWIEYCISVLKGCKEKNDPNFTSLVFSEISRANIKKLKSWNEYLYKEVR